MSQLSAFQSDIFDKEFITAITVMFLYYLCDVIKMSAANKSLQLILCCILTYIKMISRNDDITTMRVVTTAINTVGQRVVVTVTHSFTVTLPTTHTINSNDDVITTRVVE